MYYLNRITNITDPNKIWIELSTLELVKSSHSSPLHFFTPTELNTFYSVVSSKLPRCFFVEYRTATSNVRSGQPLFGFPKITPAQVSLLVASRAKPNSHLAGPDLISLFTINRSLPIISTIVANIFNLSLKFANYPLCWKRAYLRPLSKVANPSAPPDTRPIANLCEISKIFERLIHMQLANWVETNHLFDPRQAGFRAGHRTQHALLRILDDVRRGMDERSLTIFNLFDFSKAFDTVPYLQLLVKIKKAGLCWLNPGLDFPLPYWQDTGCCWRLGTYFSVAFDYLRCTTELSFGSPSIHAFHQRLGLSTSPLTAHDFRRWYPDLSSLFSESTSSSNNYHYRRSPSYFWVCQGKWT